MIPRAPASMALRISSARLSLTRTTGEAFLPFIAAMAGPSSFGVTGECWVSKSRKSKLPPASSRAVSASAPAVVPTATLPAFTTSLTVFTVSEPLSRTRLVLPDQHRPKPRGCPVRTRVASAARDETEGRHHAREPASPAPERGAAHVRHAREQRLADADRDHRPERA